MGCCRFCTLRAPITTPSALPHGLSETVPKTRRPPGFPPLPFSSSILLLVDIKAWTVTNWRADSFATSRQQRLYSIVRENRLVSTSHLGRRTHQGHPPSVYTRQLNIELNSAAPPCQGPKKGVYATVLKANFSLDHVRSSFQNHYHGPGAALVKAPRKAPMPPCLRP